MTGRYLPPPGTVPLPEGVPELRAERFELLRETIEERSNMECLGHDQTRPGGADPHGRFVVLAEGEGTNGIRAELTRCSSLQRCSQIAEHQVREGWTVRGAYDLDTLESETSETRDGWKHLPVMHKLAAVHIIVVFNSEAG